LKVASHSRPAPVQLDRVPSGDPRGGAQQGAPACSPQRVHIPAAQEEPGAQIWPAQQGRPTVPQA
jgi:hypothetical protein